MPKKIFSKVQLPRVQQDCCMDCPLLGEIPKEERQRGTQENLVCLGTHYAMSARAARSKASEHDTKHPLKRSCDGEWERWHHPPYFGAIPIRIIDINKYRDPFTRNFLEFHIIFPSQRGRKTAQKV